MQDQVDRTSLAALPLFSFGNPHGVEQTVDEEMVHDAGQLPMQMRDGRGAMVHDGGQLPMQMRDERGAGMKCENLKRVFVLVRHSRAVAQVGANCADQAILLVLQDHRTQLAHLRHHIRACASKLSLRLDEACDELHCELLLGLPGAHDWTWGHNPATLTSVDNAQLQQMNTLPLHIEHEHFGAALGVAGDRCEAHHLHVFWEVVLVVECLAFLVELAAVSDAQSLKYLHLAPLVCLPL